MDTPLGASLLLTLLTTDDVAKDPITLYALARAVPALAVPADLTEVVQANIDTVVNNIEPLPGKPNLIKDVAQKELYETLYSIIEKQYEAPQTDPLSPEAQMNRQLNGAIGMALESAIRAVSKKEAAGEVLDSDRPIITLRDELRKKIIEALIPRKPPAQ